MAISQGDKLPSTILRRMGNDGPEEVTIDALTSGRKIVLFGLPGAFTRQPAQLRMCHHLCVQKINLHPKV